MYTWMEYEDADIWNHDRFNTIEDCVADAKENYLGDKDRIYVGECENVVIGGVDLSSVLDSVEYDMYEQVGEVSEGWDISKITDNRRRIYEIYEERMLQLVLNYIKEIGEEPSFYRVTNIREVKLN